MSEKYRQNVEHEMGIDYYDGDRHYADEPPPLHKPTVSLVVLIILIGHISAFGLGVLIGWSIH